MGRRGVPQQWLEPEADRGKRPLPVLHAGIHDEEEVHPWPAGMPGDLRGLRDGRERPGRDPGPHPPRGSGDPPGGNGDHVGRRVRGDQVREGVPGEQRILVYGGQRLRGDGGVLPDDQGQGDRQVRRVG